MDGNGETSGPPAAPAPVPVVAETPDFIFEAPPAPAPVSSPVRVGAAVSAIAADQLPPTQTVAAQPAAPSQNVPSGGSIPSSTPPAPLPVGSLPVAPLIGSPEAAKPTARNKNSRHPRWAPKSKCYKISKPIREMIPPPQPKPKIFEKTDPFRCSHIAGAPKGLVLKVSFRGDQYMIDEASDAALDLAGADVQKRVRVCCHFS